MADTTQTNAAPEQDSAASIPHFCPICGALMTQQLVDGVLCWVCDECGFIDPV